MSLCPVLALFLNLPAPGLAAEAYLIMDATSGHVLDAANLEKRRQVASLTKIATVLVALDWADRSGEDLSQMVTVSASAVSQGGINPIGFQSGDRLPLRDLLYAAMMQSDNMAAWAIAEHVGSRLLPALPRDVQALGPAGAFVNQMNALARTLGMERTLFLNPHGLDATERRPPHSTARDMALLARHAMARGAFRFYVSQPVRDIQLERMGQTLGFRLKNTNTLVGTGGIDGVKTGRTARAGDCLILSAERDALTRQEGDTVFVTPRRVIVVLLGSSDRFGEGRALVERAFQIQEQWIRQSGEASTVRSPAPPPPRP